MFQNLTTKTFYAGCVVILFLPLLITPFTMYPMHYGRTMIFEIIAELLFLAVLGYLWFGKNNPPKSPPIPTEASEQGRRGRVRWNLLDAAILVFLAIQFIAAIFGVDFQMSFFGNMGRVQGVFTWFHFVLWYFLLRFLFTRIYADDNADKRGFLFLKIAGVASFLVALSALLAPIIPYLRVQVGGWGRISGTIGNSIFFASYLILSIFLNLYLVFKTTLGSRTPSGSPTPGGGKKKYERYFWIFVVLLQIFALIQSGTRGAILGFGAGIVFFLILNLFKTKSRKARLSLVVCLLFLFLISSSLVYSGLTGAKIGLATIDRLTELVSFKGTGATRLMAWDIAWQAFLEKPILGWGPENFKFVFHRHYNPEYLTYGFAETVWDKPHNLILEFASMSGALGVLSYLGIFAAAFYFLWKDFGNPLASRSQTFFSIILTAGLIAYFIQNLFIFETSNSLIVFFLVLALISSCHSDPDDKSGEESHGSPDLSGRPARVVASLLPRDSSSPDRGRSPWNDKGGEYLGLKVFGFILLVLLVCVSLWNYHIKPLRASYFLAKADDGFQKNDFSLWLAPVLKSFEIKYLQEHEALEIITRDLVGWDTKYKVSDSEMALILPILAERLESQTKIRSGHFVYYIWLGQTYTIMCDRIDIKYCQNAEESFNKAIEIAPARQDAKLLLAKVKLLQEDFEAAVKINRELVEFQPDLPVTHWFLGLALVGSGKIDEGILELEKGANFGLGYSKNILYMIDLYYGKIIKTSDVQNVRHRMSVQNQRTSDVNTSLKEYNKIVQLYKRLLDSEPRQAADWWARLAATYAAMGDKVMAEEAVTRAVELNPALEEEARAFLQKIKD